MYEGVTSNNCSEILFLNMSDFKMIIQDDKLDQFFQSIV